MKTAVKGVSRVTATIFISLVIILLVAVPESALAHARLLRSAPAADAVVPKPPVRIELWFNELLDGQFNFIEVFVAGEANAKTRANLAKGDAMVDKKDRTHLTKTIQPLPPGKYVVEWRVLSLDGHSAPGRFMFVVPASK